MPTHLFITGTDTEVGKTHVACRIAAHLNRTGVPIGVYKPVASGCEDVGEERLSEDASALWEAAGRPLSLDQVCPQRFLAPLAPPEAAKAENRTVDSDQLVSGWHVWRDSFDRNLIEGAGGLMSPLGDGMLNLHLAQAIPSAKVVIVADNRLGVIHQTLSTVTAAQHHGLNVAGIVLNQTESETDASASSNAAQIQRYCDAPLLACLPFDEGAARNHSDEDDSFSASTKFIDALFMQ